MQNDSSNNTTEKSGHNKSISLAVIALLAVGAMYYVSQVVGALVIFLYPSLRGWSDMQSEQWLQTSVFAQFFYILIAEAIMVFSLYGLLKFFRWSWRKIGLTKPKIKHFALGLAAVVPYFALYLLIVAAVRQFYPALNVDQQQQIGFTGSKTAIELIFVFISLVVLPPLVEEIVMRGFLYSALRTILPKIFSALVVSVVFGLAHLAQGGDAGPLWIGFIDTFTLSMVLVFLREKTGNLWAGITLHAVKNSIAFASLFILHVK